MSPTCPKIEKTCGFATKHSFDPDTGGLGAMPEVFCGLPTGYDLRVRNFKVCWKEMSKSQEATFKKKMKDKFISLQITGRR